MIFLTSAVKMCDISHQENRGKSPNFGPAPMRITEIHFFVSILRSSFKDDTSQVAWCKSWPRGHGNEMTFAAWAQSKNKSQLIVKGRRESLPYFIFSTSFPGLFSAESRAGWKRPWHRLTAGYVLSMNISKGTNLSDRLILVGCWNSGQHTLSWPFGCCTDISIFLLFKRAC